MVQLKTSRPALPVSETTPETVMSCHVMPCQRMKLGGGDLSQMVSWFSFSTPCRSAAGFSPSESSEQQKDARRSAVFGPCLAAE